MSDGQTRGQVGIMNFLRERVRNRLELARADARILILRLTVARLELGRVSPRELAVLDRLGSLAGKIFPDEPPRDGFALRELSDAGLYAALSDIASGVRLGPVMDLLASDLDCDDAGRVLATRLAGLLARAQRGEKLEPTI